jgi:hypothetical protein
MCIPNRDSDPKRVKMEIEGTQQIMPSINYLNKLR